MRMFPHVHIHTHMYTCTHTYTHTHIHTCSALVMHIHFHVHATNMRRIIQYSTVHTVHTAQMQNGKWKMQTALLAPTTSHLLSPPQCQIQNATIFDGDLFIVILETQATAAITTKRSCINCCIYVNSVFIFTIRKPLYYYSLSFPLPTMNRYDRYLFNSITWGQKPS